MKEVYLYFRTVAAIGDDDADLKQMRNLDKKTMKQILIINRIRE